MLRLVRQICRKLERGKDLASICDEVEEQEAVVKQPPCPLGRHVVLVTHQALEVVHGRTPRSHGPITRQTVRRLVQASALC